MHIYILEPNTLHYILYDKLDHINYIFLREITYVPGFYKIFDEILVNAADNKQRDPKMDTIKIVLKVCIGI